MAISIQNRYGAMELKRNYQKNMMLGQLSVIVMVAISILCIHLYVPAIVIGSSKPEPPGLRDTLHYIGPRPSPVPGPPLKGPRGGKSSKDITKFPVIVPDSEWAEDDDSLELDDFGYGFYDPEYAGESDEDGYNACGGLDTGEIPPPETVIIADELPQIINQVIPEYPRLAREGGFEAKVIVQAYVNREGRVVLARIVRCTRPSMGFENAAIDAAYKSIYRPAIQGGRPIGIWVSYTIEFKID